MFLLSKIEKKLAAFPIFSIVLFIFLPEVSHSSAVFATGCTASGFNNSFCTVEYRITECKSFGYFGCHNRGDDFHINIYGFYTKKSAHSAGYDLYGPLAPLSNNGVTCNNTQHPINIASGNKFFILSDYIEHASTPIYLNHYYNSNSSGLVWGMNYRQRLILDYNQIKSLRPTGKVITFIKNQNTYEASSQKIERLSFDSNTYNLTLIDNTIETYNLLGQLQSIQYPSGIIHNLTYSNNNNTVTVTRLNESLVLELLNGNVVRAVLPDTSEINYTWDTSGAIDNLKTVTYAGGTTRTYLYENPSFPHYVTGIIDENGNRISSVEYDNQGRAISSEVGEPGSGIERTQIAYHDDGTRTVTNSLGKQNIYHFTQFNGEYKMTQVEGQPSANCAAANQSYTYDTNGFMASKTDWAGNVTTYTHNNRGLETSRTEASGTDQARTITTEWHPTFNLRTKIIEPEHQTTFTYDDQGRLLSQEVSPR